jgi:hypothetical protein
MKLKFCAACGSTDDLQHHHLVTRGERRGSDDERNLITLCFGCHAKLHEPRLNGVYSISERITQAKADQKARGRYPGGIAPFGYRRGEPDGGELVPHEAEQEAIREMVRLRLDERQPLRVVVEAMAARGHKISHQSVVNIVTSSRRGRTPAPPGIPY